MSTRIGTAVVLLAILAPFAVSADTLNLVGRVKYPNGDPIAGASVTMSGGTADQTTTTNPDGVFHFHGIQAGEYTFTPSKAGCDAFTPRTEFITSNHSKLDFTGACLPGGVTLISPPDGSADVPGQPTFSWYAPGATNFEVYLAPAGPTAPTYVADTTVEQYMPESTLMAGTTYAWMVRATNDGTNWVSSSVGTFTTTAGAIPPGYRFIPMKPCRVMDTRQEYGMEGAFGPEPLAAGVQRSVPVPSSACEVPATAKGYSLNVTAVPHGALAFLTIWPTGTDAPLVSTLNSLDGRVVANAAIVPAGVDGAISVYATDATDLIIDINGYFDDQAGDAGQWFYATDPCRIADTREAPLGPVFGAPALAAGTERSFPVENSACGLPAAAAYSLNFTVVPSGFLGYLATWATGQAPPATSTLNSYEGVVVANAAIVPAGPNGGVSALATDLTDLVIDSNGYFGAQDLSGLSFFPVQPCRAVDTRDPDGTFGGPVLLGWSTREFPIASGKCGIPSTAKALVANATVVPREPLGYLTIWPSGLAQPYVSTLNSHEGRIVSNAAIVPVGPNGAISVFATQATDVIIDVAGYFN